MFSQMINSMHAHSAFNMINNSQQIPVLKCLHTRIMRFYLVPCSIEFKSTLSISCPPARSLKESSSIIKDFTKGLS
jgi:hypothetical protein